MRNCVCKMQTATIGTRPPLVASQYIIFPIIGESTVNARNLVNLVSGIIRLPSGWDFHSLHRRPMIDIIFLNPHHYLLEGYVKSAKTKSGATP